jgi:hypothetical protein
VSDIVRRRTQRLRFFQGLFATNEVARDLSRVSFGYRTEVSGITMTAVCAVRVMRRVVMWTAT